MKDKLKCINSIRSSIRNSILQSSFSTASILLSVILTMFFCSSNLYAKQFYDGFYGGLMYGVGKTKAGNTNLLEESNLAFIFNGNKNYPKFNRSSLFEMFTGVKYGNFGTDFVIGRASLPIADNATLSVKRLIDDIDISEYTENINLTNLEYTFALLRQNYIFQNSSKVKPSIALGLGSARMSGIDMADHSYGFLARGELYLDYKIIDSFSIYVGYALNTITPTKFNLSEYYSNGISVSSSGDSSGSQNNINIDNYLHTMNQMIFKDDEYISVLDFDSDTDVSSGDPFIPNKIFTFALSSPTNEFPLFPYFNFIDGREELPIKFQENNQLKNIKTEKNDKYDISLPLIGKSDGIQVTNGWYSEKDGQAILLFAYDEIPLETSSMNESIIVKLTDNNEFSFAKSITNPPTFTETENNIPTGKINDEGTISLNTILVAIGGEELPIPPLPKAGSTASTNIYNSKNTKKNTKTVDTITQKVITAGTEIVNFKLLITHNLLIGFKFNF